MDRRKPSRPLSSPTDDSLCMALDAISVSTELIEEELRPHLDTLLTVTLERRKGVAEQVVDSGILPILAQALRRRCNLTSHTLRLVCELARDAPVREKCFEAGVVSALLTLLLSEEPDTILLSTRAIGRICYDSHLQQERLVRLGAVPRLVGVLLQYGESESLLAASLLALCNLADMGDDDGSGLVWERRSRLGAAENVFHGISQHSYGLTSTLTVVRVQQWDQGQYSVSVETLQRFPTLLWGVKDGQRNTRRFPLPQLAGCPRFCKIIKYTVRNLPKNRNLKSAVFHTLL
ncbi:rap1 GTPase-GDP dissociation stimulator 1 [Chanos chanos]|uniref:Rap1 GTPase-GDP dissociation stimulator 1 n=1 Tax=Chanos chanos TaxID=29144 RepID=A0A6J2VH90_CHACN|nr:rap1 GTPase-GDP dissociation stimulator 1-like [Chanos chanos]